MSLQKNRLTRLVFSSGERMTSRKDSVSADQRLRTPDIRRFALLDLFDRGSAPLSGVTQVVL